MKNVQDFKKMQDLIEAKFDKHKGIKKPEPRKVWSKGEVIRIAKKYKTRKDFKKENPAAYRLAYKNEVKKAFSHFETAVKWSKGKILEAVNESKSRAAFYEIYPGAAAAAKRLGIVDLIKKKLPLPPSKQRLEWPDNKILKVALKCNSLAELQRKHFPAWYQAKQDGQLFDEIKEMYERERTEAKKVAKKQKAIDKVENRIKADKKRTKWTDEAMWSECQKYECIQELQHNNQSVYNKLSSQGKLREFTAHYPDFNRRMPKRDMVFDNIKEHAERCVTLDLFRKRYPKMCRLMYNRGWRELVFPNQSVYRTWTKKEIREEMEKYESTGEFHKGNGAAYMKGRRLGMQKEYEEYYSQFERQYKWTKEKVWEEALKFDMISHFQKGHGTAYQMGRRLGMLKELQAHFKPLPLGRPKKKRVRTNVVAITERPPRL